MISHSINFQILSSNHILVNGQINNVEGKFIIDTGASNSCVDIMKSEKFKLTFEISNETASSATNTMKETYVSKNNRLNLGSCQINNYDFILFNMSHIRDLLIKEEYIDVDGIIGADILKKTKALVDYEVKKILLKY